MSPRSTAASTRTSIPLASDIIKRIKSRAALYVAMLLHDIAKGLPGDHSDVGEAIAQSLCPRLGLVPEDTRAVMWLVKNHLVMSDMAQKRDISDPKTVKDFVSQVQTPEMLRLLLVLTVADIAAVGPGVWNGLEGPAVARALLRSRDRDVGRRCGAGALGAGRARQGSADQAHRAICPKRSASGRWRGTMTATGWRSMTWRMSAMPA